MNEKQILRQKMRQLLKGKSPIKSDLAARDAKDILTSTIVWKESQNILAYISLPTELDTSNILKSAWQVRKSVYIPQISHQELIFRQINSQQEIRIGQYGIKEPLPQAKAWTSRTCPGHTIILVPGLAFDLNGNRLGRGGGYYDRFLTQIRKEHTQNNQSLPYNIYGFCFEQQILPSIPADARDEKMDGLISEKQLVIVNEAS